MRALLLFFAFNCLALNAQEGNSVVPYQLTDVEMQCPNGWEVEGQKCFRIYPTERSWPRAMVFCERYGAKLAEIQSEKENNFVSQILNRPQRSGDHSTAYWMGMLAEPRDSDSATFMWSDGTVISKYLGFWAPGEPNLSSGRCVLTETNSAGNLQWRMEMCNLLLPFVCELPACVSGSFFCQNGKCVSENAHCNGVNDCGDFSDELNCPAPHSDENCLKYERGESGRIETPNYPSAYRSNLNCRWVIEGPVNSRITLNFDAFETEKSQDLVTILDGGPSENATMVLETLSGSPKIQQLTSSTNMLTVRFRSDAAVQLRGFQASWSANTFVCGGSLKAQLYAQTFSTPKPYPSGSECAWKIETTPGNVISINIENFDVDSERDFLIVYDGAHPNTPILARLTGSFSNRLIISTQNHIYLYFYSNSGNNANGFTISYKKGCDNTLRYTSGALVSPGHLQVPYSPMLHCKYTIELPEDRESQPIGLTFNHFEVASDDYLQIFEGSEDKALHEGRGFNELQRPPKQIQTRNSKVIIGFSTNSLKSANGWNITFSTNCPVLKAPEFVYLSNQNTAYGTRVTVTCKPGFEFANGRGQRFEMSCGLGGEWTEKNVPRCQPIYCSAVPQIANGFAITASNVSFGGTAKYKCYDGFNFSSGKEVEEIVCGEGGWNSVPKCKAESCGGLSGFVNGKRTLRFGDGVGFGTVFEYKCDPGYKQMGVSTVMCRSDGHWSAQQPNCRKLLCPNIPQVANGRIIINGDKLEFGDSARLECSPGFRAMGPEAIQCLANQSLSFIPECRDIDECAEETATCAAKSTKCINMKGEYSCQCLPGFKPQLSCSGVSPLIPVKVTTSSRLIANSSQTTFCADAADSKREMTIQFAAPKVIERIRIEKTENGMPTSISVGYSADSKGQFHNDEDLKNIELRNVEMAGSQIVVLPRPIEAQMLRITVNDFKDNPCGHFDLMGCQKSNCVDLNECDVENGFCSHHCHNSQGSYKCSCNEGFDLFSFDGQSGIFLKEGETGLSDLDSLRFNKSCVPRRCSPIAAPENGKMINPIGGFQFPTVIEFRCKFGYQLRGAGFLKCSADGNWNGSVPTCSPAVCEGIRNNTAIGMFITPDLPVIPYGQNVSVICTQQNRPAKNSPLSGLRQCIYDPRADGVDYWLSGNEIDCPLVDCGPPPAIAGAFYEGEESSFKVGSAFGFNCRPPYSLIGKSSYDDRIVRCNVDGSWDLGDLRCEGPVCVDPGHPEEGRTQLESVEEGASAHFSCNRPGFRPFPSEAINCTLGTPCLLSEDVGISSGFIPDGAFSDSDTKTVWGYEPHKARMSSTGWCGSKESFIFLSVDLQRIYTLTTLRIAGVAGSGHLKGHVTKLQLFHKVQFSQNYDSYAAEFETASGNHNRMYQFELNPPIRARYVLLGVTEYEENPCLRFDMFGCLAPLSSAHEIPSHLQVGWNASVPQCVDAEPPTFRNCPANPIFAKIDENGQFLPIHFEVPTAVDNSGSVAHIRVEPRGFRPPFPIHSPMDVKYTAFDEAGNSADCIVQLRVPDNQPPAMKCPDSYALSATINETERSIRLNATELGVAVMDSSNITELRIRPTEALLRLNSHVDVEVTALDVHSNQNSCKFQIALLPEQCSEWSLRTDDKTIIKKCSKRPKGTACSIQCKPGYRFVNETATNPVELQYGCTAEGGWSPNSAPPSCVPVNEEPARYEVHVDVEYSTNGVTAGAECLPAYAQMLSSQFDPIGQSLSQRCSSSVQIFVRLLDVDFMADRTQSNILHGNFTLQILPTVQKDVFYELCGLTLRTLFDLRIPGATIPVKSLLMLDSAPLSAPACPVLNATSTSITQSYACSKGEILKWPKNELPECVPCAKGTAFVGNACIPCPEGSFQDKEGQSECKACPEGTFTETIGSQSRSQCLTVCGNGMFSPNGLIPCQLCPRHTFAGPPTTGGYKKCTQCPENTYTANLGATGPSQCKKPCGSGRFSATGLEPCSQCPVNFYQPNVGQQRCLECPENMITHDKGSSLETECKPLDCSSVRCQNKGTCAIENHKLVCECRPGFRGKFCEEQVPLCDTHPCQNSGVCEAVSGTFRCVCPQNFTGARCQFGPDECIGVSCPNGGICQDLPGIGTTRCVCRTGFTGVDCSEIADPCQSGNPCRNGADCVPLQLGRYKCKCLPGWEGLNCERNIDDCKENPCALGAVCHDLINDFECECPHGFGGKRCHIKEDLCSPDPCVNGHCVDTLFDRKCICDPGWAGEFCEQNIDECSENPCRNGGVCLDQLNGYICQCPNGFYGPQCQHMFDHCGAQPCQNNATCTNNGPKYHCECPLGFEGLHCEHNINECDGRSLCDLTGTDLCEDKINGYECQCRPGYTGTYCDVRVNECAAEPCANNGTCVEVGAGFRCECRSGWKGERCESEAGPCDQRPCRNDGNCVNLADDYFCVCPEGVNGKNCENAPNRCIGEPCHNGGVCGDFGSHVECSCPKGFVGDGCQFEADPCRINRCHNEGKCVTEKDGGYHCLCAEGFTGVDCETEIDECSPSPCPVGSQCIDQLASHYCRCPFNMTGVGCDKHVDEDYDIQFGEAVGASRAALAVPMAVESKELSLSVWVRFDVPHSRGDVLALYNSQVLNGPVNLTEILRLNADSVRLALFADEPPLTLHFPQSQRLNDGHWNNLIITWSSKGGEYSLIWNGIRLYADSGYGNGKKLKINVWVNLGHPVDGADTDPHFVGAISRLNLWNRVVDFEKEVPIVVANCHNGPSVSNGIILLFADYDRIYGNVEKISRSSCGRVNMNTPMRFHSMESRKNGGVAVEMCPKDIFIVTNQKEVNVSWIEPTFSSANPISRIEKNLKSGQMFTVGEFMVLYVAHDNESNVAECMFKIRVTREFCPDLPNPVNGIQKCEHWGPDLKYRACSIQCDNGFAFSEPTPLFYTCGADGIWRPRTENAMTFKYPQCSPKSAASRMIHIHVRYPAITLCNTASRNILSDRILQRIHQLNQKWSLCSDSAKMDDMELCVGAAVKVNCVGDEELSGNGLRRVRRESPQLLSVRVDIPVKREMLTEPRTFVQMDAADVIQTEALTHDLLNLEQVLPNGRPDLDSFRVDNEYKCPNGEILVGNFCVPCSPGTQFDGDHCLPCPVGKYQSNVGQSICEQCPQNGVTSAPGAVSIDECKPRCESGYSMNLTSGLCEECGYGFFQSAVGAFQCRPCGLGKTTLTTRAISEEECRDDCPDGEHLSSSGFCQPCPLGSYRTRGVHKRCVECPIGTTTENIRSVRRSECNTPKCSPGQFLVISTKQCRQCPRGTFQDEPLQTTCRQCPLDHTTADVGATHESQCYSTNQCSTGEDNCSWHAICVDLPDEGDVPSFECRCKPGFNGNGTHCIDACTNFCLNDGVCRKNAVGYAECVCKESFSGERCEIRFQPRTQKIAIMTGAIGFVVLLLILIVVVIWLISYRFNRNDRIRGMEKFESPLNNHYLYGRTANIRTTAPIGFYYEDDSTTPYDSSEVKTMFVGGANDSEESGPSSTKSSSESAQLAPRL